MSCLGGPPTPRRVASMRPIASSVRLSPAATSVGGDVVGFTIVFMCLFLLFLDFSFPVPFWCYPVAEAFTSGVCYFLMTILF
jgi:hypothetical protein